MDIDYLKNGSIHGIPVKFIAVIVVAIVVVAAVAVVAIGGDKNNNGDGNKDATLTMRDDFRVGDDIVVHNSDGYAEYVITSISDDEYTVCAMQYESIDDERELSFVMYLSKSDIRSMVCEDTSGMTKTGTAKLDTKYGHVDVTQYRETKNDSTIVHSVTESGICISETEDSETRTKTSTMFNVNGSSQSTVSMNTVKITINSTIIADEEDGDGWTCLTETYILSDYSLEGWNDEDSSEVMYEAQSQSGSTYTVRESNSEEEDPMTETFSYQDLRNLYTIRDPNYTGLTSIGTEVICTTFGYVSCVKYSMVDDGRTYYLYADENSGAILVIANNTTSGGQDAYHVSIMHSSIWTTS